MATKRRKKAEAAAANEVSRRRFLRSVLAASAATGAAVALPAGTAASGPAAVAAGELAEAAGAAASVKAGTAVADAATTLKVLTEEQARLFASVLNRLIPADGAMPGAGDIGLAGYVDGVLADGPHLRQPILGILNEVTVACGDDTASPHALDSLLARLESTHEDAFASLIETVYTGYYSHPQVLDAIGWVHPGTEADTSETLDATLLEDVIRRGPVYKHV